MDYLSIPFTLKDGYLKKVDLRQSLTASIGMILATRVGALPFNPEYGCNIWEKEFSDLLTANKADLRSVIRNAIDKHEKRLYNVSVTLVAVEQSSVHPLGVAVKVTGIFKDDNNEEQKFEATFNLG